MPQDANGPRQEGVTFASGVQRPSGSSVKPIIRSSTSIDDLRPGFSQTHRRSSLFSDFSAPSIRSSDSLLFPNASRHAREALLHDETSHWHSAPLAFAILPALGGLFFQNGSAFVTDISLLILAAIFLNWSVRIPWDWYRSAQQTRTVEVEVEPTDAMIEEESEEDDEAPKHTDADEVSPKGNPKRRDVSEAGMDQFKTASEELRAHERLAFLACFLGPVAGTYVLHAIRSSLSRPSEGLVSDFNLTIFLLAAELRPFAHLIKMVRARTMHLQRLVSTSNVPQDPSIPEKVEDLGQRINDMETRVADIVSASSGKESSQDVATNINKQFQSQLDALTRAVRRYEKRQTTQSMITEARLQDLEARLKDTLSLAAVAARDSQKPGVVIIVLNWLAAAILLPFQAFYAIMAWPVNVLKEVVESVQEWITGKKRVNAKGIKGKGRDGIGNKPTARTNRRL
ncbi:hypothetical protein K402DRAFT_338412 [Aulographum hederae CBS 113979]|uniref:Uncharacterized protein n=1 Tax=Aulographum hederae CBS 113979 TaxID=1176131 RepID=A0A6G1GRA1_9PEZI|nr:hypothetical protein K402DRAFT_338412 [Aulographum hederae CBS 113979]